jgi:N-acyl-D-amino-acid deacylase
VEVSALSTARAVREFDARGCLVCPGFIDTHSHSDAYVLSEPSAPSKLFQGVTTEVVGQCGMSAAPRYGAARMSSDWEQQTFPGEWKTVAEYRSLVDRVVPASNVILLVGHNLLRAGVMGYEARDASPEELAEMERRLDQALEEGGWGFSTGLVYPPGRFAPASEIATLARRVAARGGLYASHMRSEGVGLLDALNETLHIGRETGVTVVVSHLKTSGRTAWPLLPAALEKIESARAGGLRVFADRYPYTAGCTDLDVLLPAWAMVGTRTEILARLRDPVTRDRIRAELEAERTSDAWDHIRVGSTDQRAFLGRPLPEVAREMGCTPADAALRLIDRDNLSTGGIFFGMSEENMWTILAQPWVMIGSDASLRSPTGPLSFDHPHPRAYGTFPRLLRAALDGRTVPIEEMIRKMTSLPADVFGISARGRIEPDGFADVVVFDPGLIRDRATYEKPHQVSAGFRAVWVNGIAELLDGDSTGLRGGRFLAPPG